MAEATDRPRGVGEVLPEVPVATETYRPLSLLALAGFGLAVVYALVVLVGAAVALFGRIPWLMPNWTFLLPLAALTVCWAARTRIHNAEGTLSGSTFTTWGFRLTIIVGLTYAAYYGATFFAVRGQAIDFADDFFKKLKEGRIEQAFMMATGVPTKDMSSGELRDTIESRFNNPGGAPGGAGPFTRFRQTDFVRFIETDGPQGNIAPMGVSEWEYKNGGYRVALQYHVTSSLAEFDLRVETFRHDSKPGEPKGQQWQVVLNRGETGLVPGSMKQTPLGAEVMRTAKMAYSWAADWADKINLQQWSEAYLDTLPPSERVRLRAGQRAARLLATAPLTSLSLGLCDAACRDFLAGEQQLASGQIIHLDDKTFWAGKQKRADIIQRIRKTFEPAGAGGNATFNLSVQPGMPRMRVTEERTTVMFDANVRYLDEKNWSTQYVVEGQLVVSAKAGDSDTPSAWWIESLDLESGRTPPAAPERPRPPAPPGPARPGMP